jgi:hypothetical protein
MLGPIQAVPANDVPTFITVIHGFFLGSPLPSHLQTYRGHRLYNSDSLIHHPIFKELHAIQLIVRPCRSQHHITLIIMLPASQPHRPQVSFPDPSHMLLGQVVLTLKIASKIYHSTPTHSKYLVSIASCNPTQEPSRGNASHRPTASPSITSLHSSSRPAIQQRLSTPCVLHTKFEETTVSITTWRVAGCLCESGGVWVYCRSCMEACCCRCCR